MILGCQCKVVSFVELVYFGMLDAPPLSNNQKKRSIITFLGSGFPNVTLKKKHCYLEDHPT